MEAKQFDLLVIGGGLSGLGAAIQFAKEGWQVALFEKEVYPFHKVCGEYISNESLAFIESLGVALKDRNLPRINQLKLSDPAGNTLEEKLELGGFGISRFSLDHALVNRAKELGVMVNEGAEVKGWNFEEEVGFSLELEQTTFKGSLLLAAYGKRSKLDKWLERPFMLKKEPYVAVKYHIRYPVNQAEIVLHNFKNGYCGMSAIEDGRVCLCYLAHAEDLRKQGSIVNLEKNILSKNPHLAKIFREAEFLYDKPLVISRFSFKPKKQIIQHAVFVGDAAGLIPPLSGNGMSMALHGAKLFYDSFSPFLRGDLSRRESESQYQESWRKEFGLRLKVGRTLQSLFGAEKKTLLFFRILRPFAGIRRLLVRATHGQPF